VWARFCTEGLSGLILPIFRVSPYQIPFPVSSRSRTGAPGGARSAPEVPEVLPKVAPAVKEAFPDLSDQQWEQLERLGGLVQEWNQRVNVISRKDIENIIPNHVVPCIGVSKLLRGASKGARVMDVGTGGGFPGLPLAICLPHLDFLLVDSIGKKVRTDPRTGLNNDRSRLSLCAG
jgi:hypothetical protein